MYTWAGAQSLPHVLRSIGSGTRVEDTVGLGSPMDLLVCAGERARGERAGGGYARALSLQHAISSIGSARRVHSKVGSRSLIDLLACAGERAMHAGE